MADDVVGLRYISEGLPEMLREIKSYQTAVSGVQRAERQKASATKESSRATSQNTQETKKAAQAEKEWFALQRQRVQLRQNSARLEERAIQQVAQAQRAQDAADRAAYQRYIRYQNEKAAAAQRSAREQARAAEQAAAAERRLAAEKDRLTAKFNPLYAASKQYERALNEIARAQQIGALNAKQHEAAVEQLNTEFQAFQSGTAGWSNQFATGAQRGAREVNRMGMVMQQTGYQVGDFLVQVQSGTNWMVAFGQQATQLAGLVGLVNPALIGVGAALGIIIPLVTALGAAWMRTRGAAEEAALAFKDVSGSLTTLEDVRLARLGEGFANNAERASDAFKEILATVERVAAVNLRAQLLAPLEAVLDEIRRFDTQSNLQSRVGGEADFESTLGLKSRQEAVFLAQQLRTLEGETREELLQQADAIAEALRLRGIMTPQVDALLKSLADELGLMEAITSEQSQQTDGFAAQKTEMEQAIALQRVALQFGEDSLAVRRLENQQAQENLTTRLREQGLTDEQVSTLVEMLRVQQSNAEALRQSEAAAGGLNSKLSEATGLAATLLNILGNVPAALAGLAGQVDGVLSSLERQNAELNYQLTQGLSASAASVKALRDEALATAAANGATIDELARVGAAFDEKAAKAEALSGSLEKNRKALQAQTKAASGSGKAAKSAASDIDELRQEVERLNRAADPFATYAAGLERLTELSRAGLSDAAYSVELERMNEELVKADPLLNGLNDAFGQLIDYAFDGFKDGMRGIWDIFKNTLKQMIVTAAKSRITFNLGMAGSGGSAAGAMGGAGGGNMLGTLGSVTGIGSAFMGGMSNVIGSTFGAGGSFAMGLQSIGAQVSAAIAGPSLTSISAALGAVALPVAAIVGAVLAFKKETVEVAQGVRAEINGATLALDSYVKTKEVNGLGMSSGFDREFTRLDDAVQTAVQARIDSTVDALGAFGLGTDLTGFSFSKRTEIKEGETFEGETEEVIREALDAAIAFLAEGALDMFQRTGESLSETLDRLTTSFNAVMPATLALGNGLLPLSLDGAAAANAIIELNGGLESFVSKTGFFLDNFFTDAEKMDRAKARLSDLSMILEYQFGTAIPKTHEAFRDLVAAQDLTTAGGRELHAALLDVQDEFIAVHGTAQDAAAGLDSVNERLMTTAEIETERVGLLTQIARLEGDTAFLRQQEIDGVHESNQALVQRIHNLQDEATAAAALEEIDRSRIALLNEIARVTGNVTYLRQQELAALDASVRPLQEFLYALEDTVIAARAARDANNELLATLREQASETENLISQVESALGIGGESNPATELVAAQEAYDAALAAVTDRIETETARLQTLGSALQGAAAALGVAFDDLGRLADPTLAEQLQTATQTYETALSELASHIESERNRLESEIAALGGALQGAATALGMAFDDLGRLADPTLAEQLQTATQAYETALSELANHIESERNRLESEIAALGSALQGAATALGMAFDDLGRLADPTLAGQLQTATQTYNNALDALRAGIDRDRAAAEARLSDIESQRKSIIDTIDSIVDKLRSAARGIFRDNERIVELQRKQAVGQLRQMLATGDVNPDTIDDTISRATSFGNVYATRTDMMRDQAQTASLLDRIADEQQAIADAERAEKEIDRRTLREQLRELKGQTVQAEQELRTLDAMERDFGRAVRELTVGELATNVSDAKDALTDLFAESSAEYGLLNDQLTDLNEIARVMGLLETALTTDQLAQNVSDAKDALTDLFAESSAEYGLLNDQLTDLNEIARVMGLLETALTTDQLAQNVSDAKDALTDLFAESSAEYRLLDDQLTELEDAVKAAEGIEIALTTGELAQNLADAKSALTTANTNALTYHNALIQAINAINTQITVIDGQNKDLDDVISGGGDDSGGNDFQQWQGMMAILKDIAGASATETLGAGAFSEFNADGTNAIISEAAQAALTGFAADIAAAYDAELGRNVDVRGLRSYTAAMLGGQSIDDIISYLRADGDQFQYATSGGGGGGSSSGGGGSSSGGGRSSGGSTGDGGMPEGWERPNGVVAALFGTYGVPWSDGKYNRWLDNYADRNELYGGYSGFQDAWMAAFEDDFGKVPSYRNGTDNHPGGPAITHANEMITFPNMPRGTSVTTAGEVAAMVGELKSMRAEAQATKEYIRELVKINLKQARSLKEIEFQGETAT